MQLLHPPKTDGNGNEKNKTVSQGEGGKQAEGGKQEEDVKKDQDGEQGGERPVGKEKILMNLAYPLDSSRPFRKLLKDKEQQETGSSSRSIAGN